MTHRAFGGERTSAESSTGATSNKGNFVFRADADDRLDLLRSARQSDCAGRDAEGGKAIALICLELVGCGDETGLRKAPIVAI